MIPALATKKRAEKGQVNMRTVNNMAKPSTNFNSAQNMDAMEKHKNIRESAIEAMKRNPYAGTIAEKGRMIKG